MRTVGFLDILGFRRKLLTMPIEQLVRKYQQIIVATDQLNRPLTSMVKSTSEDTLFPDHPSDQPWCIRKVFSDSIILIAHDDDDESCLKLLIYAWRLSQVFLAADLPLRGGIAYGEIYADVENDAYVGGALTSAYDLQRNMDIITVAIDSTVENRHPRVFAFFKDYPLSCLFFEYPIPLKDNTRRTLHTINWRWNMVVKAGTRSLFPPPGSTEAQLKIDNTFDYVRAFLLKTHAKPLTQGLPLEFGIFWVGASVTSHQSSSAPFQHGDDL